MASASSSSARSLFAESRAKLVERVAANVEACGSLCRQVVRGSRSHETLLAAARATAAQVGPRATADWDGNDRITKEKLVPNSRCVFHHVQTNKIGCRQEMNKSVRTLRHMQEFAIHRTSSDLACTLHMSVIDHPT